MQQNTYSLKSLYNSDFIQREHSIVQKSIGFLGTVQNTNVTGQLQLLHLVLKDKTYLI